MRDLDSPGLYASLDPTGLLERMQDLARQCEVAWNQAKALHLPEDWTSIDKVVICGMGGSAIAGDLVADLASSQETVPILVVRDLRLPFRVDRRSLVIACSYSGNTEETLSLYRRAVQDNARVLVVAGGGWLAEDAIARGIPLLRLDILGEPRGAVGYNLMLLLGALHRLGLVRTPEQDLYATADALRRQASRLEAKVITRDNPAKQLALELQAKIIAVYGGGVFSGVARRWKTQLNENAKAWAFFEVIPELLHNSVEAFRALPGMTGQVASLLLQPSNGPEGLLRRFPVVAEMLGQANISCQVLRGIDGPPLAEVMVMLSLGDHVSYYLALLNGVNPSPTPAIDLGKERLGITRENG
ncbi:MAG: bifunctional phosphoglucose/phosphomannose isomerase [Dehalococcoidia bacterium]|nr:bifunctional phosphoglucose/phosphomannose isomerase [Dehalococcoidia bacterium]